MSINQKIIYELLNLNDVLMDFLWILTDIFCNYGALKEEKVTHLQFSLLLVHHGDLAQVDHLLAEL